MKAIHILAVTSLLALVLGTGVYAAEAVCPSTARPETGIESTDRQSGQTDLDRPGRGPELRPDVPFTLCGTFCEAGQYPVGWPYDWQSSFWLRPNSNY